MHSLSKFSCIVSLAFLATVATADETGLQYGSTVLGSITCGTPVNTYTFAGTAGDKVFVEVAETSDFTSCTFGGGGCYFDQYFEIDDTSGFTVSSAESPLASNNCSNQFRTQDGPFVLPHDGTYTITVHARSTNSQGAYTLYLQRTNNPAGTTAISPGAPLLVPLQTAGSVQAFVFTANQNASVNIQMQPQTGNLVPMLALYGPDGTPVALPSNGMIRATLAQTGTYTLLAFSAGAQTGTYLLTLQPLQASPQADFNADGKSDILWRQESTGLAQLWLMNGTNVTATSNLGIETNWSIAGVGDFNGDGKADILWQQTSNGVLQMWLMNGSSLISAANIGSGTNWAIAGVGDFDGDGKADILWQQASTGAVQMWLMDGSNVTSAVNVGSGTTWTIAGVGDFNGDGKTDILWQQPSTGAVQMWLMNGSSVTSAVNIGSAAGWTVVGVGDFNGDGNADILWRQTSTGVVQMWLMNGPNLISAVNIASGTDWTIAGVGDFNGDGKADILWRQTSSTGVVQMWLMNGSSLINAVNIGSGTDWSIAAPR